MILAKMPNMPYESSINTTTNRNPTNAASFPDSIESAPRFGPILLSSMIFNCAGSAPARKTKASSVADSTVKLPEMIPSPPSIGLLITGALNTAPSSTTAKRLPLLLDVASANFFAPK